MNKEFENFANKIADASTSYVRFFPTLPHQPF